MLAPLVGFIGEQEQSSDNGVPPNDIIGACASSVMGSSLPATTAMTRDSFIWFSTRVESTRSHVPSIIAFFSADRLTRLGRVGIQTCIKALRRPGGHVVHLHFELVIRYFDSRLRSWKNIRKGI